MKALITSAGVFLVHETKDGWWLLPPCMSTKPIAVGKSTVAVPIGTSPAGSVHEMVVKMFMEEQNSD